MSTIKLGLIDDHNLFREGIKSLLDKMPDIDLVLEAVSGKDLLTKLNNVIPDVILLDLEMEDMNGVDATLKLQSLYPDLKIIILTMHKEERMISYLMEVGANGYLLKDTNPVELEEAIRSTYEKGYYFNPYVSQALLKGLKHKSSAPPSLGKDYHLTEREREVLELITKEFTTAQIAEQLFLSIRTIEGHRKNLMSKLGVKNTAGLIIKAVKEKIISV
ncbi:response regulator transcription factor [Aquimarina sp. 2201CG5-10]|uniref:response regulator transcription factor n=1 Tax=Aquimarina callyspongiae TaxID=3098150 RepID=UPI002AB58D80|nr:response regulator transcription factor [Aquimarina sp. 2201CG5-10]MDY8135175.1 response regulator transcription factor [Aquimarina sp. 2201CG5-10]